MLDEQLNELHPAIVTKIPKGRDTFLKKSKFNVGLLIDDHASYSIIDVSLQSGLAKEIPELPCITCRSTRIQKQLLFILGL